MSETADLLLEIGCEELPPGELNRLAAALCTELIAAFERAALAHDAAGARAFATPRRLAVRIPAVAARQADREVERRGPALNRAFDAAGQPTAAALGFARSVGIEVDALATLENDQGRWLVHRHTEPGRPLGDLLSELLAAALAKLPIARPMRWGDHDFAFVRPVHWLLALHGTVVLPVKCLGQTADRLTRGHRIHAPEPLAVPAAGAYETVLNQAKVMVDTAARRATIEQQLQRLAEQAGLNCAAAEDGGADEALLDEVAALTEWPVGLLCAFDPAYLAVPAPALAGSMTHHQKFFPLYDAAGCLAPRFVAFANLESTDPEQVRAGFERVIRPRLEDARFFWEQDCRQPLAAYAPALESMVYQRQLGSLADKTRRVTQLATRLADKLGLESAPLQRAAELARCDLATLMVGEFPELQGVMGRYYALHAGESEAVAAAIESHYLPRRAGDPVAADEAGSLLAIADRADTLVGIFAAGLKPSGKGDPYALRRAALGLVRTVIEGGVEIGLDLVLSLAAAGLADKLKPSAALIADVRDFIFERLAGYLRDQGIGAQTIQAVFAAGGDDLIDIAARARGLEAFAADPAIQALSQANKRAANLLRQAAAGELPGIDETLFDDPAEQALYDAIDKHQRRLAVHGHDYHAACADLARLAPAVDRFFTDVMVMVDDLPRRHNRLALLAALRRLFLGIADLGLLAV